MVKAFVFGKFLPFHIGHEAMIRFALGHCDYLSIVICCSNKEPMSGNVRENWIRESFEGESRIEVKIFEYFEEELPNTSVSSMSVSESWASVFSKLLPDHSLLITSEPYGDYVAQFMHIKHILFDKERKEFPISASQIRTDLHSNWKFLPKSVRSKLAVKVVLLGTESTGKTTLTQQLAAYFNCSFVLEAAREIIPDSNAFSFEDLTLVCTEHAKRIEAATKGDSALIIIDTDVHITISYSRFVFQKELLVSSDLYEANKANLYLYLCNDAAYIQDGTRLDKEERNLLDISHRNLLNEKNVPFVEINGKWDERFEKAVKCIENLIVN